MKASKTDVLILVIIAAVSGLFLSGTFTSTKEDIAAAQEAYKQQGLRAVMPFMEEAYGTKSHSYNGQTVTLYTVEKEGQFLGAALELKTKEGYSGWIKFLLGVDAEQKVTGLYILQHAETPGLGSKATEEKWWGQFVGKMKPDFIFKVEKDGGDVVSITASTITSRAIADAVDAALDLYADFLNQPNPQLEER